jgi:hypothetical protein
VRHDVASARDILLCSGAQRRSTCSSTIDDSPDSMSAPNAYIHLLDPELQPVPASFFEESDPLQAAGVVLRAHAYAGVLHPPQWRDHARLLRALDLMRASGKLAEQLMPVILTSPRATICAWVRAPRADRGQRQAREVRCSAGWVVMAGAAFPQSRERSESWLARAFDGQWDYLVGEDGAYVIAAHDARSGRFGLAHDRFGLLRQVYVQREEMLWFATSTNALAVVPGLRLDLVPEQVAAMGINLTLRRPESPFRGIARPLANTGHWFSAPSSAPLVYRAAGAFPRPERPPPSRDELVEQLNAALLQRVANDAARPECDTLGVWMTSGVDSRWMAAAAHHLGLRPSFWTIGTPGTLDFETAQAYARDLRADGRFGVIERLEDVVGPLAETNWWLQGRVSLIHQFLGSIWEELRAAAPVMLQGYVMNWMKWLLPNHAHRRAEELQQGRTLAEAREALIAMQSADARKFKVHLMWPELPALAEARVREVLAESRPLSSYHGLLALQVDNGPLERSLSLARIAQIVGGGDAPLMDRALVDRALEAARLPYRKRRQLQPSCIVALDPKSANLPTTPWSLPPRAMAGSLPGVTAYALTHPAWLRTMLRNRRTKAISPNPIRRHLFGTPEKLAWARRFLHREGRVANTFGEGLERFCDAVEEKPHHKPLGVLWGLVAMEMYMIAFERAAAGQDPPWDESLLPG